MDKGKKMRLVSSSDFRTIYIDFEKIDCKIENCIENRLENENTIPKLLLDTIFFNCNDKIS